MANQPQGLATLVLCAVLLASATAQQTYYFQGAITIYPGSTAAVQAQCPADHPVSCSAISEPDYCCPVNNYCAWSNSAVACCPQGQTCTGNIAGQGGYQPTSWYPSTTTWDANTNTWDGNTNTWNEPLATTTVYAGNGGVGGGAVYPAGYGGTTTLYTAATTTLAENNGEYCSTQTAKGPNLPTTGQGECGTILIVAATTAAKNAGTRAGVVDWSRMLTGVLGLYLLGVGVLIWR